MGPVLGYFSLLVIIIMSSSSGELLQVTTAEDVCSSDTAVFICTHEFKNYLVWEVFVEPSFLVFHGRISSATTATRIVGISKLQTQLNFVNDSSINSTLTIMGATNLNGTLIRCDDNSMIFNFKPINSSAPINALFLTTGESKISITWNNLSLHYFNIEVFYSQNELLESWNSSTAFATVDLVNSTIDITVSFCKGKVYPSHFIIDPCLYYEETQSIANKTFVIYSNGSWKVTRECDGTLTKFQTTCSSKGEWRNNTECLVAVMEESTKSIIWTPTLFYTTTDTMRLDFSDPQNKDQEDLILMTTLLPASIIVILLVLFIVLLKWLSNRRKKVLSDQGPSSGPTETEELKYEQIICHHQDNCEIKQFNRVGKEEPEYATLISTSPICMDEYASVLNNHQSNCVKENESEYAEISTYNLGESKSGSDHRVDYSSIHTMEYAHEKLSDLEGSTKLFPHNLDKPCVLYSNVDECGYSTDTTGSFHKEEQEEFRRHYCTSTVDFK